MHHHQTKYSILEHAIVDLRVLVYAYFCKYTLFIRITLGVGVETMSFYIMHMCSLMMTIFYGIEVVPLQS